MSILHYLKILIFYIFYGKVEKVISAKDNPDIKTIKVTLEEKYSYNIFEIKNAILYNASVHDCAIIFENKLVDEVKEQNNLKANQIILGGFSQGCMITLQTGIKRKDKINSIIGYSGRIIDTNHLSKNINSRPNIILMHGERDQIVTVDSFLEAKDFFGKNNYEIEAKIFKNCEHRIPTEGSSLGLQFIKKHFNL